MARRSQTNGPQNPLSSAGQSTDMQALEAAVRAMQAAMSQSAAASQGASADDEDDIIWNDPTAEVRHPNELGAKVWVHSPGRFVLPAEPTSLLLVGHKLRTGDAIKKVDYIKAGVKRGTSIVYLLVGREGEPSVRACKHTVKGIEVNLSTLLVPNNLQVLAGFKELYPATLVPSGKWANALMVDLAKYEKRQVSRGRNEAKAKSSRSKPATPADPATDAN